MRASPTIPAALVPDFRYCLEVVAANQENFPVGSRLLPRRLRPHLHAVYAFARTADDFADHPSRPQAEKLRLLDDWQRRLEQAADGRPDHPIFRALAHTMASTGLPPDPLADLLAAFRLDVVKKRYETLAELDHYCRHSANPVGRIVLHLAGCATPENIARSDAICSALQLTNHWQDLGQDPWAGRPLYLPREEMARFGVAEEEVLSRRFSAAAAGLMLHLVELTRALFENGQPLVRRLPWPLNLEVAITWEAGMILLERIEEQGGNTLRHRPTLARRDWWQVVWRALGQVT